MYKGEISTLACSHNLHSWCAEKLLRSGADKCPECRRPGAFTTLLRPEPPKDKLKDLKIQNNRYLQEIVMLKRQLKKLEKVEEDKEIWEREARSLWNEFVTDEKASSDFIWRARSKKYI